MAIEKQRGIRLQEFLKSQNIKQVAFAKRLNTDRGFVSQIINGHSNLTTDMAFRIGKAYPKLNRDWLLDGVGQMLIDPAETHNEATNDSSTEYEQGPFAAMHRMMEEYKRRLDEQDERIKVLENLLKEGRGYESKG